MGRTSQSGWTGSFVAPLPKVDFLMPGRVGDGIENGHGYSFSLLDKLVENLIPFFLG